MSHLLQRLKLKHQNQLQLEETNLSHALYSYLEQATSMQNNLNKTEDEQLLLDFVFLCLSLVYWRERQEDFFSQIKRLLEPLKESLGLNAEFCQRLCHLQVCSIHSQNTLYEIIEKQVEKNLKPGDKLRILPNGKKHLISLILSSDGLLFVKSYLSCGVIYNGQIWPLSDGTYLKYSPEMDLLVHHLHIIKKGQNNFYFIRKMKDGFSITDISGITFLPNGFDRVKKLENHIDLYYDLKRLEQFFVDRSTDPYYKNLVYLLEAQIQNLSRNPFCVSESVNIYEKAWNIFEKVFQDDKLLSLLLKQLNDKIDQIRIADDAKRTKKDKIKSPLGPEWGM